MYAGVRFLHFVSKDEMQAYVGIAVPHGLVNISEEKVFNLSMYGVDVTFIARVMSEHLSLRVAGTGLW